MTIQMSSCSCSSGLYTAYCCGFDIVTMLNLPFPSDLAPLLARVKLVRDNNDYSGIEQACLQLLTLFPVQPDALRVLLRLRLSQDNLTAAEALATRLVTLAPNDIRVTQDLDPCPICHRG